MTHVCSDNRIRIFELSLQIVNTWLVYFDSANIAAGNLSMGSQYHLFHGLQENQMDEMVTNPTTVIIYT